MTKSLKIPDELKGAYQQIMRFVPPEFHDDKRIQDRTLVYLKLGGVKMARHSIEILKKDFKDKINVPKKRRIEETGNDQVKHEDTDKKDDSENDDSEDQ